MGSELKKEGAAFAVGPALTLGKQGRLVVSEWMGWGVASATCHLCVPSKLLSFLEPQLAQL